MSQQYENDKFKDEIRVCLRNDTILDLVSAHLKDKGLEVVPNTLMIDDGEVLVNAVFCTKQTTLGTEGHAFDYYNK